MGSEDKAKKKGLKEGVVANPISFERYPASTA